MRLQQLRENYPIDNVKGLGSVPNNQEVDYLGLRVLMRPSKFIQLAAPLGREHSAGLETLIKNNEPIGAPFLIVKIPEEWFDNKFARYASIIGHEGRNRMIAIQKVHGDEPIEVHLFLADGLRSRHLTEDIIDQLRIGMFAERSKNIVTGWLFDLP